MKTLRSVFVLTGTIVSLSFALTPTASAQLFGPVPNFFEDENGLGPIPDFLDERGFGPVPDYFGPPELGHLRLGDAFSGSADSGNGTLGPVPDLLDERGFGPVPDYFGPPELGHLRLGDAFSGTATSGNGALGPIPDYQTEPGRFFYQGTLSPQ